MKITVDSRKDITVLTVRGKLVLPGEVELRQQIEAALASGANKILVNLGGVRTMDSSAIGLLVAAHDSVRQQSGTMKLCALRGKILSLVHMTELHRVFEIFETEEEALASFEHPESATAEAG